MNKIRLRRSISLLFSKEEDYLLNEIKYYRGFYHYRQSWRSKEIDQNTGRTKTGCLCSEIESFYTWENDVQNDQEFRIMFKTTKDKYKDVEKAILKIHPYDLPAIYAVDVDELYKPYGDWVNESLK